MTEIFLIRHTQAEGNIYRMIQGFWDGAVTADGILQQQALRKRFENIPVDAVYSSDLYRAVFTAQAVAQPKGLEVQCDMRLREINVGPWERAYFGNLKYAQPQLTYEFMYRCEQWHIEGAETYAQVRERVYEAMEDIARKNDGKRIAIVSHGVSIRCFTSKVTGISLNDTKTLPIYRNTSVSSFSYSDGVFTPIELNDYSHLNTLPLTIFNKTHDLRHEFIDPILEKDYYTHCYSDSWLAAHGSLEDFSPSLYLRSAEKHHRYDERAIIKLYDEETPAGLVDLDIERAREDGVGWISLLYLEKPYRGKGYGTQALARAIMLYKDMGREKLRLHVADDNTKAFEFYRRNGFKVLGKDGGRLFLMEKEL